jgi:hypothetical protein
MWLVCSLNYPLQVYVFLSCWSEIKDNHYVYKSNTESV